ncbi:hypothetical protein BKA69DRAFT_220312 [Paraphysoderma sedebokerense]|nr:hypothetical protein BKA69DRAFT_218528 [Paraphysoderma sedebokerense]KAI9142879.1 hypothetical protein BKA69DRAFT_220312 [Paraphysoderma sedebokerense]
MMKKYHPFLLLVFAGVIGTSLWFSFNYSSSYNMVNSYITSPNHHKPVSTCDETIRSNPKSAFPEDFQFNNISEQSDFKKCWVTEWNSSYIDSVSQVRVESAEAFAYVDWSKSDGTLNTIHGNCTSNFFIKAQSASQWTLITGNSSQFHGDYIVARCNHTGQSVDNLFIQPPLELNRDLPTSRQVDSHITKSDSSISDVIVILLDAVSRFHFHDEFPRTSSFLKRLHGESSGSFESFEFENYNSLGGHSPTNKVPMFGGSYFNDTMPAVEWLWDLAKTHDYITMHADPQCGGRNNKTDYKDYFNHTLIGYYGSSRDKFIADYIFPSSVFCLPKDEGIKKSCKNMEGPDKYISWYGWLPFCLAHRPSWEYQFEYITEFLKRTKKPGQKRFVMFNIYETHQPSLRRTSMDIAMRNMLETMFGARSNNNDKNETTNTALNTGSGLLAKSSAVFLLSDHGIHYDREYETYQGRIYHKRPFNHLILSNKSFQNFPSSDPHITRKIIQDNTQKLTSHFDLFSTLKQFITGNYSSPPSNFSSPLPTSQNSSKTRINDASIYGRSFLFPIPSNRTCNTSGIPAEFCPCNIQPCTPEEIQSQISNSFDYINRKLVYHRVDSICPLINSTDAVIEYCDSQKYIDRVGVNMEVKLKSKPYVRLQLFRSTKGVISRVLYEDSEVRETCFSRLEQAGVDSKKWQYPCLCM